RRASRRATASNSRARRSAPGRSSATTSGSGSVPTGRRPPIATLPASRAPSSSPRSRRSSPCDDTPRAAAAGGADPRRGREGRLRQARAARARPDRASQRRSRPARGSARSREDAHRALVRAGDLAPLCADPVHARPHAGRRHRLPDLRPADDGLRLPARPRLREPPPRRRDQPRPAEDAGGAARGDAGAAGDDRERDPPARAAVPRACDAEPDRVRGDVPAARGAARPLPRPHLRRLSRARPRDRDARAEARARRRRRRARARRRRADARRDAGGARAGARLGRDRGLHRRSRHGDAAVAAARRRREPAWQPRAPQAVARQGGARRTRLRHSRGREGGCDPGARAPADAAAGAMGAAAAGRGRRSRGARDGADAARRGRRRRQRKRVTRYTSARVAAYAALAAAGLIAGLALGRVEPIALAAPLVLALVAAALLSRPPDVSVRIELERDRAVEGDEVLATITLSGETTVERLELLLVLPEEVSVAGGSARALRLRAGEERTVELTLRCDRWGGFAIGPLLIRACDVLGFRSWEGELGEALPLRVYPAEETLLSLVPPLETQVFAGNQVARARGEGIEF